MSNPQDGATAVWGHISEDRLELYSMGRLSERDVANIEQHLLICSPCRRKLEEVESFVGAIRAALSRSESRTFGDSLPSDQQ